MSYLFYRLVLFLNTANRDDLNYTIAEFVLQHINEIPNMNIVVFANECHVSPASISRFCRKLGFDDYIHLKMECNKFTNRKITEYNSKEMIVDPKTASHNYVENQIKHLRLVESALDFNQMDAFIKEIFHANTIALFGSHFSHSVAEILQTNLFSCNKYCIAKTDLEQQIKAAESLTKNDLAVIITVRGNYLNSNQRLLRALKKSNADVVFITASHDESLKQQAHRVLYIADHYDAYMGGRYALLSYVEILSTRMISMYSISRSE